MSEMTRRALLLTGLAVPALRQPGRGTILFVLNVALITGQVQTHGRTLAELGVDLHPTARLVHKAVDHR